MDPLPSLSAIFNFDNFGIHIPLLVLLILLIILSSFFSSSETAYSTANLIRLKNYAEEKRKGARKAVYIVEKFDLTLTTILVGNNFVNIAATTISAFIITSTIINPTLANIVSTFLMTIIILIFGEIIPKQYAKENAEKFALRFSGIMYALIKGLYPITFLFLKLKNSLMRKSNKEEMPFVTEDELESIIEVMEGQGVIDTDDAELFQNAITLNDKAVYDIMTPRVDMVAVEVKDDIETIKEVFFEHQFSRIPVFDTDKDRIVGILSERNFFTALLKNEEIDLYKLMSAPYFVSKSTRVDDLIREMQKLKKHFAVVSDEYGGTSGIVTMEDALEELVGEIYDEYDDDEEDSQIIKSIQENEYLLNSEMEIDFLFETLNLGTIPDTSYATVGGLVYELCEALPEEGDEVHYHTSYEEHDLEKPVYIEYDLVFTITKVESRRIREVKLKVNLLNSHDIKDKSKDKTEDSTE